MQVSDIYLGLGQDHFAQLLRHISIGKLKTFQLFDRMKIRMHLPKLNSESLRKAAPRLWSRMEAHEEEFASELAQAILISHLEMIRDVLDALGIPHEEGFFAKDLDPAPYLTHGWQERIYTQFKDKYPQSVLLFYINHLDYELAQDAETREPRMFHPAA